MNRPISVGITGGIGVGKTLITKIFSVLGVPIYYADERAKILMNTHLVEAITSNFGTGSYVNGKLNRDFLAKAVFANKTELKKLNDIVHPAVAIDYKSWQKEQSTAPYVIKEAALLIETGSYKHLDNLIVVTAPNELRLKRILERDSFRSKKEIQNIISNQLTDNKKVELANYVIENDEQRMLVPQVLEIDKKIRQY